MIKLISKIAISSLLLNVAYAQSQVVLNLPEPPEECKLLADATCVYDASTGKYTIVGDNSEFGANEFVPQPQNEDGKNFDSIKSKILATLENKLKETAKLKECTLAADNMTDLKECKTEQTLSSNSKFNLRKDRAIKSVDKKIDRINKRIDKTLESSKFSKEKQKKVLSKLYNSVNKALDKKSCLEDSTNNSELKSCRLNKKK